MQEIFKFLCYYSKKYAKNYKFVKNFIETQIKVCKFLVLCYNNFMGKFVVVDGNNLIYRTFYALPMLKSLSGKPSNAIYGFVNTILNVLTNEKPNYLVCVFDAGKHTFRHEMYADYKAGRDKTPDELLEQIPVMKELLRAMGILVVEKADIEADDIIGSFTKKFDEDFKVLSGDKDLLQLINQNTVVWQPQRGAYGVNKIDEEALKKEYNLRPEQIIDLKALMGDSSDNIPGVAGIGKVGALKLLEEFDNLDNIYNNLEKVGGATRNKLIASKDMAYLSKQLVTIKMDVELNYTLDDCKFTLPFSEEVSKMLFELDFKSVLNKKEFFVPAKIKTENHIKLEAEIIEVDSETAFAEMLKTLNSSFAVTFDELSLHLATENKEFVLYPSGEIFNKNQQKIKALFENEYQKICFDSKALMHKMAEFNIDINNYFDLSIAIYIANEMDAEITLDDALKLNEIETDSKASAIIKMKEMYINKLINNSQLKLYSDIELPLAKVLFEMEQAGIKIDVDQIKLLSATYHEELNNITTKIYELAGEEFNINSPKQLQTILFEKLNIEYKGKKGTGIEVLNAIVDRHEIVNYIIRYRKIAKLISTYLDGMLNYVDIDGKIHTTFMQRTTSTGRLSSREPNLQNLPIRDDEGRALRKMFSSSFENGCIVSADYNQIELRLIANFSNDENMVADYLAGKDIHSATASKIFNLPINQISSNQRRTAKIVNFGIIYGISAFGLSQNLGCSTKDASNFIKRYLEVYPRIEQYGAECIAMAREKGYVSTIMGRIRHIPDINSSNHNMRAFAERVAKNTPLQGSASDIIKIAMIKVFNRMQKENLKSKLIIQIHDELVVDCASGEEKVVSQILKEEMESVINLKVPLIVEVNSGKTLYDAK